LSKARKIVQKQLEIAQWLEMDCILVVPGMVTPHTSYQTCYTRSQEQLADLGQEALRRGIHIGVENVWNRFLLSPLEMSRFLDEIGLPSVRAYFDVGNALQFGYPQDWIRTLGKRIVKIHVKDFLLSVGNIHGFVPLFAGDVDWDAVRTALHDIGYDDYLTAELTPYQHYPVQLIFDTAKKLDTLIGDGGHMDT
jgi:L-ribulose-5-phosphate 3-epimerase